MPQFGHLVMDNNKIKGSKGSGRAAWHSYRRQLRYFRLYDSTVAADYYRAMGQIEGPQNQPVNGKELLGLLDVLQSGDLDETQQHAARALRVAIQSLDLARVLESEDDGSVADSV